MTFRNMETLQTWLADFISLGYTIPGSIKVIVQDGADGADTGLIAVHLVNAPTVVYIQPATTSSASWVTTMEPRDEAVVLDAARLLNLSSEIAMVSALCGFLEARSESSATPDHA